MCCCLKHFDSFQIVDDDGNALDNNVQGEVWIKRELPFFGYYGDAEKTAEAYDGEWFKTGDIGYFDDDGFIYVIDRKKELLKFNNYQVTPSELENIINGIDGVASSCVVGVLKENTGNDVIHAFVIVDESKGLTEDFVLNYVNDRVIDAKRLRGGVHFLATFPLGPSGKVDRKQLTKIAKENFSQ
jgi:4-coumarate--CoA ligase